MEEKVYIFISHSHKDIEKVRKIRNFLEKNCSEPILFFLKSKDDDDEITSLIEEEIDARIWFIYCDSKNARESIWVKKELDYVKRTGKRNCTEIDLDNEFDSRGYLKEKTKRRLKRELAKFLFLQRITISYSHHDKEVVEKVRTVLNKYDIVTTSDSDMLSGADWFMSNQQRINKSSAMLYFLSENSIKSQSVQAELRSAQELNKDVFVVYLDNKSSTMLSEELFVCSKIDFRLDVSSEESLERGAVGLVYYLFDHISQ